MVGNNIRSTTIPANIMVHGAVHFIHSQLNMYGIALFHFNEARSGGAIHLDSTNTSFSGSVCMFKNRAVSNGGALYIEDGSYEANNYYK